MVGETLEPVAPPEPHVRVYLAGGIALRGPGGEIVGEHELGSRQARLLFVRLAAIHEPVPHVELADDLWGPDWPPAWEVALRALISKLRSLLARAGAPGSLVSGSGAYALHLPAGSWLDIDAARAAVHDAETARAGGRPAAACGWALAARSITTRPILAGEESEWLERIRRQLVDVRLRSLECLGEIWIAQGDPGLASRDAMEAIDIDPYRETAHRLLVRAYLAAGDRGAAARALETCRRLFEADLGVAPSAETLRLMADPAGRTG